MGLKLDINALLAIIRTATACDRGHLTRRNGGYPKMP